MTPSRALEVLAANLRDRRLAMGLTQVGLSVRSGVPVGTLRKFERTGAGSTEVLVKLLIVVGGLEAVVEAARPDAPAFASLDAVLAAKSASKRKHGWRT